MRKTSLKIYATETLMDNEDAPDSIRGGAHTMTDGTVKGVRAGLLEHGRSGIITDEITTTYEVSNNRGGLHYINRNKLCTWVNCEKDTVMTGQGRMQIQKTLIK